MKKYTHILTNQIMLTNHEPKVDSRFIVKFPEEIGIPEYITFETQRPIITIDNKGKIIYHPVKFKLYDPIGPSTSQALMGLFDIQHHYNPTLFDKIKSCFNLKGDPIYNTDFSKFKKGFNYDLDLLDPTGIVIEKWRFFDCIVKSIDFGGLNYTKDNLVEIEMVVQPKKVFLIY